MKKNRQTVYALLTVLLTGMCWQAWAQPPQNSAQMLSTIREALRSGHPEEALQAADEYERQYQNDPEALSRLATMMSESSQHQAAVREYARLNELRPHTPDILYNLGVARYHLKHLDEAAQALAESADLEGGPAEIHYSLGLVASESGDHEDAVIEFRHALDRTPQRADFHYLLGQEYFKLSYWEGAAAAYQRASELDSTPAA